MAWGTQMGGQGIEAEGGGERLGTHGTRPTLLLRGSLCSPQRPVLIITVPKVVMVDALPNLVPSSLL